MKSTASRLPVAIFLIAACCLSAGANAQDSKKTLATKLAQMQLKAEGPGLADQLTSSAMQPLLENWSQRLDETVPPARQKDVREKLDIELRKFNDNTHKAIEAQLGKAADAALVPVFIEKFSEDELKAVIAYMESPVYAKFRALGPDAANAWAQKVVEATRTTVENNIKSFDTAANKIIGAPADAGSGNKK